MKYIIMCLTLFVQLGCSSVIIKESELNSMAFCNNLHMPDGISDMLKLDDKGVAFNCPDIEEVKAIADIKIMPYPTLQDKIVGIIIVKKTVSYEPYCKMIGSNIIVLRDNVYLNKKSYDIYDAYYSDK